MSDPDHQRTVWGRFELGVNHYEDLTLHVHVLYDDCQVLPDPDLAVPAILNDSEVPAFRALEAVFGPLLDELGERPDADYFVAPGMRCALKERNPGLYDGGSFTGTVAGFFIPVGGLSSAGLKAIQGARALFVAADTAASGDTCTSNEAARCCYRTP